MMSGGDVATLGNGQAVTLGSSGLGMVKSNETITLSSGTAESTASATDLLTATDDPVSSVTETSEPAEGGGVKGVCSVSLMMVVPFLLLVAL